MFSPSPEPRVQLIFNKYKELRGNKMTLINKAKDLLSDISVYWNAPLKGR